MKFDLFGRNHFERQHGCQRSQNKCEGLPFFVLELKCLRDMSRLEPSVSGQIYLS